MHCLIGRLTRLCRSHNLTATRPHQEYRPEGCEERQARRVRVGMMAQKGVSDARSGDRLPIVDHGTGIWNGQARQVRKSKTLHASTRQIEATGWLRHSTGMTLMHLETVDAF